MVSRLRNASSKAVDDGGGGNDYPLEGTKFAFRETRAEDEEEENYVEVVCPYGEVPAWSNSF